MHTCAWCGKSIPDGHGVSGNLLSSITGLAMAGDTLYCSNRCKDDAKKSGGGGAGKKIGGFLLKGLRGL